MRKYQVAYFAASVDQPGDNEKFAESLGLDYPILSDPDKSVAKAYGVLRPDGGVANRWTFFIGKDGKVLFIDKKVSPDSHAADIARKLDELGVEKN